jgi:hypothetical protein
MLLLPIIVHFDPIVSIVAAVVGGSQRKGERQTPRAEAGCLDPGLGDPPPDQVTGSPLTGDAAPAG